jgi:hypothetical protein
VNGLVKQVGNLEYWIQKVLPMVYDDSLSHYELLNKVVEKLNEVINQSNEYFGQDLESVIENILNDWEDTGRLSEVINQTLFDSKVDTEDFDSLSASVDTVTTDLNNLTSSFNTLESDYTDTTNRLDTDLEGLETSFSRTGTQVGDRLATETNDNGRLQRAFNTGGVVILEHNQEYFITESLTIDVNSCRGIQGNNARIRLGADITGLVITGSHLGTAHPDSTTQQVLLNEMNFFIHHTRIHSDGYIGTAISVNKVFNLTMKECHLFNLLHGISFLGNNRNITLSDNQIYNLKGTGIGFTDCILHQMIISNNHISYCNKALHHLNSDLYNLVATGNVIETSSTQQMIPTNLIHFDGGRVEGITFTGNNLEDHFVTTDYFIKFENLTKVIQIHFVGNEIGNAKSGTFFFERMEGGTIVGNTDTGGTGNFLTCHLKEALNNLVVSNNVFAPEITNGERAYFFEIDGLDGTTLHYVGQMMVSSNTCNQIGGYFINFRNTKLTTCQIVNNNADVADGTGNDWMNSTDFYIINIKDNIEYLRQVTINSNQVRGRMYAYGGIAVSTPTISGVLVKDNISRQILGDLNTLPSNITGSVDTTGNLVV